MSQSIQVTVGNPPRGGTRTELQFYAQSIVATFAWGSSPGTATIVYVGTEQTAAAPVSVGDFVRVDVGGHSFYGICRSDSPLISDSGNTRTLEFVDFRGFLSWDQVYCAFNMPEVRLVGGLRYKFYWHILPADWSSGSKTYTTGPLLAYQILDYLFSSPTVNTSFVRDYNFLLNVPVYGMDFTSGRSLAAAVTEISERVGVLFTQKSTSSQPRRLEWCVKGFAALPAFPNNSTQRRLGVSYSNHPSRLRVVGDRNLYQVMDVPMERDWASGWESLATVELLARDLYTRAGGENWTGWFEALARANEITVGEYADLAGASFLDTRMYSGRSRRDMPAALYINTLLFRAFRPVSGRSFTNVYGHTVYLDSAELVPQLLARVTHNPDGGAFDIVEELGRPVPADGNGYAIAQGYMVGQDLFASINPHQFDLEAWIGKQNLWQQVPFQIDDAGTGQGFIIFEQPVIVTADLLAEADGHAVVKFNPTITVPSVQACLTYAAERYFYPNNVPGYIGTGSRDGVENVSQLNGEYIVFGGLDEIPFADGLYANDKAAAIANSLLNRQAIYVEGGYRVQGSNVTALTPVIDRVTVSVSPQGMFEQIDFTNERVRNAMEPERDLDRRTVQNSLFPGQLELQDEARKARLTAAALNQSPGFVRYLERLMTGNLGSREATRRVQVDEGEGFTFVAGTVFWSDSGASVKVKRPGVETAADNVFAGVSVRNNEDGGQPLPLQTGGVALTLVLGPVLAGDSVGKPESSATYLEKGGSPSVGVVMQPIEETEVKLVQVRLGQGSGDAEGVRYLLMSVQQDVLICRRVLLDGDGDVVYDDDGFEETVGGDVRIAKVFELQTTPWEDETIEGVTYSDFDATGINRTATRVSDSYVELQEVIPPFVYGFTVIFAKPVNASAAYYVSGDDTVQAALMDDNRAGRAWSGD